MTTADRAERMERITDQIVAGVRKMQSDIRLLQQAVALGMTTGQAQALADAYFKVTPDMTWKVPDDRPTGAVIEIIERGPNAGNADVIVPNDVRINGQSLWCSADDPVIVHKTSTRGDDVVRVTLTLLARRVVYGTEADVTPDEEKP